ncbi:MAG: hypothetical protein SFY56_01095 [Bacteroidota bacterium]|nr:hypothetical protein [Bacteroidota bacterium]
MKKINYRKIFVMLLWIISLAGIAFSWAFVNKNERNTVIKNLNIAIQNNDENPFITEADINTFFRERKDSLLNNKYKNINIPQLEKALNSHPAIQNAEVAGDIDGELKISITQRTPVLRIINKDGESYYIDSQSKLMPLNENYSARVLVANGFIYEPFARRREFSVDQIKQNKTFKEVSLLDDILDVSNYITNDSILNPLIQQIFVNEDKEIELFPSIGNQKIIFGNAENISEKFNKLKLFYTQGLNKTDAWTKYSSINLKYKNIVVCTKK